MASVANTVTLSTNFNVAPYYDDFDESKNFHRHIFRPGLAVQARELTQIQTILQNQIDRFAEHVFKEGSAVRGCEVAPLDLQYDYVKLRDKTSTNVSINVYSFQNKIVKGSTSGVLGKVINVSDGSEANTPYFKTIYVDYISGNTSTGFKKFANNEILTVVTNSSLKANTITSLAGGATGYGSSIRINSGIIFAKDHFIRVDDQTLILDPYSNSPTYRVGYNVIESIITESDDSTLLDPASGSYNYAAPGAARLKLEAVLTKTTSANTNANTFIEFVTIKNGIIQTKSDAPQYSLIRDELAKRTADESGDYIVRGLATQVREHYNDGTNQGVYTTGQGGNTQQLSVDVAPGKAYVQGYDNELLVTQHVAIDKGIDYVDVSSAQVYADYGNYLLVDNLVGSWDIGENQGLVSLRGRTGAGSAQVNAVSTRQYSSATPPGTAIGTARVRSVEYVSGTPGTASAQYRLHLADVRITTAGKSFANTESVTWAANSGFASGRADVLRANNRNANTYASSDQTAVFQLPASAIRRLRNSSGAVADSFGFWKTFHGAFDTTGSLVITLSGDEQFTGSGSLSSALQRQQYIVVVRSTSANTGFLTGTVSTTSGSNTVTGSGTSFLTQVNAGDLIRISNTGTTQYLVSSVNSDTSLSLLNTVGSTRTAMKVWKEFKQGQVLDLAGYGKAGARSITINTNQQVTININETMAAGFNATVHAQVKKVNVQEAGKTIVRDRYVQVKMGSSGTTGYTANTTGPWNLGVGDGFRLVSVRQKTGTFSSTTDGTDVTSHFYLDNGQRDAYYDHAKLVLKPTSTLSIGGTDRLLVKLDYFTHNNRDRGFFGIGSYPVNDTTAGANSQVIFTYQIPVFVSPVTGTSYDLRDCVDFRPRLTDTANSVTSLTNISTNPQGIDTPSFRLSSPSFDQPAGGLRFPYSTSLFTTDLSYYLPRKDLIVMNSSGICEDIRGVSSKAPMTPLFPKDKMVLGVISVSPYPSLPDEIARRAGRMDLANDLQIIKNLRYTMHDVGALADRIDRLEYYTALTLLEKDAQNILIPDTSGIDRFKNGFLVDAFTGHNVGNVYDPNYKFAIDPVAQEGRPSFKLDNIRLVYNSANSSNVVRTNVTTAGVSRDQLLTIANSQVAIANGATITSGGTSALVRYKFDNKIYVENATGAFTVGGAVSGTTITSVTTLNPGPLVTLPYTHERVISQPFATTTRNAASLFYSWTATLSLNPSSDHWVDTVTNPDIQTNPDNNLDNLVTSSNPFGTVWGGWSRFILGDIFAMNEN